ncbi:hypothetical protein PR003_g7504 [Phytophthora rubi]|uniref:Uncharacterized protein n=1 Tax=Phytophthora rubi TaxID=129364 RepID=A0A6A3M6K4_9STRA|nr:hypothetical protein PR002_g10568 [Phytophthora rubi]KAE9035054.1 hypothetical protein PR001_g9473 [Phytophthora rubi]KAE9346315.1 hypothetical protein PR003_g7504 [Phytophthora rubi]
MDLSEIPFDVPVILQSLFKRKNLQNPLGSKTARCLEDNRDVYEQLILRRVRDDKVAIQSVRNNRYLQVRTSGQCVFDPKAPGDWELFTMETDASCALFFVSCHTGLVLQCDDNCVAKCDNSNRLEWESWRILEPRSTTTTQVQAAPDRREGLVGKERQDFILALVNSGKTVDEIDQIVSRLFDAPAASASAFAVPVDKA